MIIIIVGFIYLMCFSYLTSHEAIHKLINGRYGIESRVVINYKTLSGFTYVDKKTDLCNDYCKTSHALNDIVGYYFIIFIFNTWALLTVYLIYNRLYKNGNNTKIRTNS